MDDDCNKQKRIDIYLGMLKESLTARMTYTLQTSSVVAVIISILTVSNFFSQSCCVQFIIKIIFTFSIIAIPFSLFLYLYEINKSWDIAKENLENEIKEKLPESKKGLLDLMCMWFPWIFLVLLSIAVVFIIILI